MQSKIVITNDFDALKATLEGQNVKIFECDEFLIENARELIAQAYIAESQPKLLAVLAKSYRKEAQNALLKIIEEPPRNVYFLFAVAAKNLLLQTIRSRLIIENRLKPLARAKLNINLKQLDLAEIYRFLEQIENDEKSDKFGKNELKELISQIVLSSLELGYKFSQNELEHCYKLVTLADLNAKSAQILTPLLLTILHKGRP